MSLFPLSSPFTPRRFVEALIRYVVGAVFLYAAVEKVLDPFAFAQDVANYRLLSDPLLLKLVALTLPALELVAGVCIVAGPVKGEAAAWIALMLVCFIFGEGQALARGLDLSCGCFGKGSGKVNWLSIGRNVLLLAGSLWVIYEQRRQRVYPVASGARV